MFQRAGPITAPAAPSPSVPAGDLLGQVAASAFMGNEPGSGPSQGSDAEMATVETEAGTATNAEPALPENVHKITSTDQFVELIESCPLVVALFGCEVSCAPPKRRGTRHIPLGRATQL